jgi:hypothetical protein
MFGLAKDKEYFIRDIFFCFELLLFPSFIGFWSKSCGNFFIREGLF